MDYVVLYVDSASYECKAALQREVVCDSFSWKVYANGSLFRNNQYWGVSGDPVKIINDTVEIDSNCNRYVNNSSIRSIKYNHNNPTQVYHLYTDIFCDSVYPLHLTLYSGRQTDQGVIKECDTLHDWLDGRTLIDDTSFVFAVNDSIKKTSAALLAAKYDIYKEGTHTYTQIVRINDGDANQNKCFDTVSLTVTIFKSHDTVMRDTSCGSYDWKVSQDFVRNAVDVVVPGAGEQLIRHFSTDEDHLGVNYYGLDSTIYVDSTGSAPSASSVKFYTSHGCDSTIYLFLALYSQDTNHSDTAVCKTVSPWQGIHASKAWLSDVHFAEGTQDSVLRDTVARQLLVSGLQKAIPDFHCDSFYRLDVRVYNDSVREVNIDSCVKAHYSWGMFDSTYRASRPIDTTIYDTLRDASQLVHDVRNAVMGNQGSATNAPLCDSTLYIKVHLFGMASDTVDTAVCHDFYWKGQHYLDDIDFATFYSNARIPTDTAFQDTIRGVYHVTSTIASPAYALSCDSLYVFSVSQHDTAVVITQLACVEDGVYWHWADPASSDNGKFYLGYRSAGASSLLPSDNLAQFTNGNGNISDDTATLRLSAPRFYNGTIAGTGDDCPQVSLLRYNLNKKQLVDFPGDSIVCDTFHWSYKTSPMATPQDAPDVIFTSYTGSDLSSYADHDLTAEGCDSITTPVLIKKAPGLVTYNFCQSETTYSTRDSTPCALFTMAASLSPEGVRYAKFRVRHAIDPATGSGFTDWGEWHEIDTIHPVNDSNFVSVSERGTKFNSVRDSFEVLQLIGTTSDGCKHYLHAKYKVVIAPVVYRPTIQDCDSVAWLRAWNDPSSVEGYYYYQYDAAHPNYSDTTLVWRSALGDCSNTDTVYQQIVRAYRSYTTEESIFACDSLVWGHRTGAGTSDEDYFGGGHRYRGGTLGLYDPITGNAYSGRVWTAENYVNGRVVDSITTTFQPNGSQGCDSTVYLRLTLSHSIDSTLDTTIYACERYTWNHNDSVFFRMAADTNQRIDTLVSFFYRTYGTYGDNDSTSVRAALGHCDTTFHLPVHIYGFSKDTEDVFSCEPMWRGLTDEVTGVTVSTLITHDTMYRASDAVSLPNGGRCLSERWFNVTIHYSNYQSFDTLVCDSASFPSVAVLNSGEVYQDSTYGQPNIGSEKHYTLVHKYNAFDDPSLCPLYDTIRLHIYPNAYDTVTAEACYSYYWRDNQYDASGIYENIGTQGFQNTINGKFKTCKDIHTLVLTIHDSSSVTIYDTACTSYDWHNFTFDTANYNSVTKKLRSTATFEATQVRAAGEYARFDAKNIHDCDSFTYLFLDLHSADTATMLVHYNPASVLASLSYNGLLHTAETLFCDNASWTVTDGTRTFVHNFDHDSVLANPDTLLNTRYESKACDSIVFLSLSMGYSSSFDTAVVACDSLFWELDSLNVVLWNIETWTPIIGHYKTESNQKYTHKASSVVIPDSNQYGCDSTVNASFLIIRSDSTFQPLVGCDSVVYNGITYRTTLNATELTDEHTQQLFTSVKPNVGDAFHILNGCDSVVTYIPTVHQSGSFDRGTLRANGTYNWTVQGWDTNEISGLWTNETQIDSTYRLAAVSPTIYNISDTVNTVYGCDSVITAVLEIYTNFYHYDTMRNAACDSFLWTIGSWDSVIRESGVFEHTIGHFTNDGVPGDSIYQLVAQINYTTDFDTVFNTTCNTMLYNTVTYTYAQTTDDTIRLYRDYKLEVRNAQNCDSFYNVLLVIHQGDTHSDDAISCDSIRWLNDRWAYNLDSTIGNLAYHPVYHPHTSSAPHDTVVTHEYLNHNRCRSIDTLHLTLYRNDTTLIEEVACEQKSISLLNPFETFAYYIDTTFTSSIDTVYQRIPNAAGCAHYDHIVVTISGDSIVDTILMPACDTFHWDATNATYTRDTLVRHVFLAGGDRVCDSIVYLNVSIKHGSYVHFDTAVCDSFVYNGKNFGYTYYPARAELHDTVGYFDPIANCWSVDTLDVLIIPSTHIDSNVYACDSYTFNWVDGGGARSKTYTASGTYYDAVNRNSEHHTGTFRDKTYDIWCNYLTKLILTIGDSIVIYDSAWACDSYTWATDGLTYTMSNYDSDSKTMRTNEYAYRYAQGEPVRARFTSVVSDCDSIRYLHLFLDTTARTFDTVIYSDATTWTTLDNPVSRLCDSVQWHDMKFFGDTVLATPDGRDRKIHRYSADDPSGTLHTCDSLVTLVLSLGHTTDTILSLEDCGAVFWADLKWYQENVLGLAAHPDNGYFISSQNYDDSVILTNHFGCDSVMNAVVKVNTVYTKETATIVRDSNGCDSLVWGSRAQIYRQSYTVSSTADSLYDTIRSVYGCDSVLKLEPFIKPTYHTIDHPAFACGPFTWEVTWKDSLGVDRSYTAVYLDSSETIYDTVHALSRFLCDSMVTLEVFVNKSYDSIQIQPERFYCDSVRWYDTVLITVTGTHYVFVPTNIAGQCDTVVYFKTLTETNDTIDVPIRHSTHLAPVVANTSCTGSLTWNGNVYTHTDTIFTDANITNAEGCKTYNLNILKVDSATHSVTDTVVCESFVWSDTTGNWTVNDSVYRFNHSHADNSIPEFIVKTHEYTDTNNCLSADTLKLRINPNDTITIDTAICGEFSWLIPIPGTIPQEYYTQVTDRFQRSIDTVSLFRLNSFGCARFDSLHFVLLSADTIILMDTGCEGYTMTYSAGASHKQFWSDTTIISKIGHDDLTKCDIYEKFIVHIDFGSFVRFDTAVCADTVRYSSAIRGLDTVYRHIDTNIHTEEFFDTVNYENAFGCESSDTIHVILFRQSVHYDTATACNKYDWGPFTETNGNELTRSGDTSYSTTSVRHEYIRNGVPAVMYCDTTSYLHLHINTVYDSILEPIECNRFIVPWNGAILTPANYNTYTKKTIGTVAGATNDTIHDMRYRTTPEVCDTVIKLLLTLSRDTNTSQLIDWQNPVQFACDSILWHDRTLYHDTILDSTFSNRYGCDSTVTLTLRLAYANVTDYGLLDSCEEVYWEPWKYYLESIQGNAPHDSNGYFHHTPDRTLEVRYPAGTARGSQVYNYTDNGTLYACDSIVRATIVVRNGYYDINVYDTACDELVWAANGHTYRQNFYQVTDSLKANLHTTAEYPGQEVCDSILVLHPTLYSATGFITEYDTIVAAGSVNIRFGTYDKASHTYDTIDSTYTYSGTGTYYQVDDTIHANNRYGCDSTIALVVRLYQNGIDSSTMWRYSGGAYTFVCDTFIWTPTTSEPGLHTHVITETGYYSDTVHGVGTVSGAPTVLYDSIYVIYAEIRNTAVKDSVYNGSVSCNVGTFRGYTYYQDTTIRIVDAGLAANFCDSITDIHLSLNHSTFYTYRDTACEQFTWGDTMSHWNMDPATYTRIHHHAANLTPQYDTILHSYTNVNNCNSVDTLYLVLYPTDTIGHEATTCRLYNWSVIDPLTGNNFSCRFTTSGSDVTIDTIRNDFLNVFGCTHYDSLHLVLGSDRDSIIVDTACDKYTWDKNGLTYTGPTAVASTEVRISNAVSATGCDSLYYLDLTVFRSRTGDTTVTKCNHYKWPINGKYYAANGDYRTYFGSGNYLDTTMTYEGCDSVVTLHLTINQQNQTTNTYDTACEGEVTKAWTFMKGGAMATILVHIPAANTSKDTSIVWNDPTNVDSDCDSVATLHLFTKELRYDTIRVDTCWSYYWRDTTYTVSRVRDVHENSSIGCDSITTLILNMDSVTGTFVEDSACDSYTWVNRGDTVDTYTEG